MCEWLAKQTVLAVSITYRYGRPQGCGAEWYVVTFESPVEDIRDYNLKKTMEFRAYGRHHRKLLGYDKALAQACLAFVSSRISAPERVRFGLGVLNSMQHHGNSANEFWVYHKVDILADRMISHPDEFDVTCETACPRHEFCHNCVVITEYSDYTHCKCLGHEVGGEDVRAVQYADDSLGHVRVQSESLFIALKKAVRDHDAAGDYFQFGRVDNGMCHQHQPQTRKLYELSLAVFGSPFKEA